MTGGFITRFGRKIQSFETSSWKNHENWIQSRQLFDRNSVNFWLRGCGLIIIRTIKWCPNRPAYWIRVVAVTKGSKIASKHCSFLGVSRIFVRRRPQCRTSDRDENTRKLSSQIGAAADFKGGVSAHKATWCPDAKVCWAKLSGDVSTHLTG